MFLLPSKTTSSLLLTALMTWGFVNCSGIFSSIAVAQKIPETIEKTENQNNPIAGEIFENSPVLNNGSLYTVHSLKGTAQDIIRIDVISENFDPYLVVIDPQGQQIAENNDGGEGTNVRLVLQLPSTGEYQLFVTSYSPDTVGTYQLQWQPAQGIDLKLLQAQTLEQQWTSLNSQGHYAEAIPLAEEAFDLLRQVWGENHPKLGIYLLNLGELNRKQGNNDRAAVYYQEALKLTEKIWGRSHPETAKILNSLALLYRSQGRYLEAESLYQETIAIYEQTLDANDPLLGITLDNLANLYRTQGNYTEALALAERARTIFETRLAPDHPTLGTSLNNLSALYIARGDYEKATPLLERSLQILETNLGENHPQVAIVLSNLATLYDDQHQYEKAIPLYQRSVNILEDAVGTTHPNFFISLNNLARVYHSAGSAGTQTSGDQSNYQASAQSFERLLILAAKALGKNHPDLAIYWKNTAELYVAQGNLTQALEALERTLAIEETNLTVNLAGLTEQQRRDYLDTLNTTLDNAIFLDFVTVNQSTTTPQTSPATELALTALFQRKGRILDATSLSLQRLRQNLTPDDQARFDAIEMLRRELANLITEGITTQTPEVYQGKIQALETQLAQQEKDLAQRSVAFRQVVEPVTLQAIQAQIPADGAVIEFVRYTPYDPALSQDDRFQADRYAAYLLRPTGTPLHFDLGEAQLIDQRLSFFRQLLSSGSAPPQQLQGISRQLHQLLLKPIVPYLAGVEHLLLSPDSQLNLIPFAALMDGENEYLLKTYRLTYLTSGRDLLKIAAGEPTKSRNSLIFANPTYSTPGVSVSATATTATATTATATATTTTATTTNETTATKTAAATTTNETNEIIATQRSQDLTPSAPDSPRWLPLPGTAQEAVVLQSILPKAIVFTEANATENLIKTSQSPRILHLATHGFFLPNQGKIKNPLLRSGLVLAGANLYDSGDEDGILTALEASGLDLRGTQLVVMSACETGLGEVTDGEGVYGLRRAFTLAGVESQVMSLWSVSDDATQALMGQFYGHLVQDHQGRSEALRQAQLTLLANPQTANPYYWAAFIPSGNWQKIR